MEPPVDPAPAASSRRTFLTGGVALVGAVLAGCSGDDDASGGAGEDGDRGGDGVEPTTLTADDFAALDACLLTPEQTEGPFYLPGDLVRRDITEGLPGRPLRLGIRVVDAACQPVAGAVVDVWHADVDGDYSGFADGSGSAEDAAAGTTFLRGSQVADGAGIVEFGTVYPGWYQGRAVHIHVKAHLDGTTVLTSQLYFSEDVTDEVHAREPYVAHRTRDTRNEDDPIAGNPQAAGNLLATSSAGDGVLGLVVLGVDPEA
ncbi:MAG TPA: intradiol ring-cleavage dioxygenase [Acidimicrobiales bacterium]|nr:intradiol ring-cleavage dioxygenase [Acidimicrobiales bacterium]